MQWIEPARNPSITTYRVMDDDSRVHDEFQMPEEVTSSTIIEWYKNMLIRELSQSISEKIRANTLLVNVMDNIMFNAQRHGRLSFYMVKPIKSCKNMNGILIRY